VDFSTVANGATVVALLVAVWQLWLGRRASSGSALISLNESLRQAWLQVKDAVRKGDDKEIQYAFSDAMNLLEVACAAWEDCLFTGKTGLVMKQYLIELLTDIFSNKGPRDRIEKMRHAPGTFVHIRHFVRANFGQFRVPLPKWLVE
jgi:hypothetical protein